MSSDSGSRAERQDRNGLGPEDGRTAPEEGHRPTSGATQEIINRLKECPFCGSEQVTTSPYSDDDGGVSWCVICKACAARVDHDTEAEAVKAWNNRSTLTNLTPSGVERIRAEAFDEAAAWHDQRYRDTPDAFEMEFHDVSRKAIRALALTNRSPSEANEDAIDLHNTAIFRAAQIVEGAGDTLSTTIREYPQLVQSIVNLLELLSVRILEIKPDPVILKRLTAALALPSEPPSQGDGEP